MELERMDHHQIVGVAEIFNGQTVSVDQSAVASLDLRELADAVGIDAGIVGIAEAEFSSSGHVAELVDRSSIGAWAAKRREIGDDGLASVHHRLIGLEDL